MLGIAQCIFMTGLVCPLQILGTKEADQNLLSKPPHVNSSGETRQVEFILYIALSRQTLIRLAVGSIKVSA
jgi:hypothetical protein